MRYFSRYLNCTLFFSVIVVRLAIVPIYVRILTSSIDTNCVLSPLYNRGYLRNSFHGCCENWQILRRELTFETFWPCYVSKYRRGISNIRGEEIQRVGRTIFITSKMLLFPYTLIISTQIFRIFTFLPSYNPYK